MGSQDRHATPGEGRASCRPGSVGPSTCTWSALSSAHSEASGICKEEGQTGHWAAWTGQRRWAHSTRLWVRVQVNLLNGSAPGDAPERPESKRKRTGNSLGERRGKAGCQRGSIPAKGLLLPPRRWQLQATGTGQMHTGVRASGCVTLEWGQRPAGEKRSLLELRVTRWLASAASVLGRGAGSVLPPKVACGSVWVDPQALGDKAWVWEASPEVPREA